MNKAQLSVEELKRGLTGLAVEKALAINPLGNKEQFESKLSPQGEKLQNERTRIVNEFRHTLYEFYTRAITEIANTLNIPEIGTQILADLPTPSIDRILHSLSAFADDAPVTDDVYQRMLSYAYAAVREEVLDLIRDYSRPLGRM